MQVRFISSLTGEDEDRFASMLLTAMDDLLSQMPISYHVRIETTDGAVLQRSRSAHEPRDTVEGALLQRPALEKLSRGDVSQP